LREGPGRAAEDRDRPDAGLQRAVQAALVRHEDGTTGTGTHLPEVGEQLTGVGELRHPPRGDEGRRLDGLQARGDETTDELRLDRRGHGGLLVLQTVTRPDLVDRHPGRHPGHGLQLRQRHGSMMSHHVPLAAVQCRADREDARMRQDPYPSSRPDPDEDRPYSDDPYAPVDRPQSVYGGPPSTPPPGQPPAPGELPPGAPLPPPYPYPPPTPP